MNTENKNLYILKLLTSSEKFQADIAEFKREFSIPLEGFLNNEQTKKWNDKLVRESDDFLDSAYYKERVKKLLTLRKRDYRKFLEENGILNGENPLNKFHNRIEKIADKYRLPYNFRGALEMYVYFNKISSVFLPTSNFSIAIDPSGRKNTAKWVELKTYARLTEKEIREAIKHLRDMQEHYLPPNLAQDIRVHKDIDLAIKAKAEMEKKKKKSEEEDFESILKHTSGEIAEDIFGNVKKAPLVRQMCRRLRKERKKLFGI